MKILKKTLVREDLKNYQNLNKKNNSTFKPNNTHSHYTDINELIECVTVY